MTAPPIGALLAGGRGKRIGGDKAVVEVLGRPLIAYPLEVLLEVLEEVVVVVKPDTVLPRLDGLAGIWKEPESPPHPLAGIVHALRMAKGRSVLACGADMPLVTPAVVAQLAGTDPGEAPAVVPRCDGRLQPLLALYTPLALAGLAEYAPDAAATDVVEALGPCVVDVDDEEAFFNVNGPEDVLDASARLDARRRAATPPAGG